ncbi:MAG: hypothetical protein L0Y44_09420 [Phycisphaerales bacterium]|nr:hypothetical protein [Phycisphaerales bacterium]MCI0630858.1 hypothetical protein [Phycisphaerales bacterium]MCI0674670.1 hypothetical protein [Phycisphaerales bacterium]
MKRRPKKPCRSRQYTLRAVPAEVDRALREQASRQRRSLNDVALEALARGAGVNGAKQKVRDLDYLIGTWVEDPGFDKAIAEQDQVEPEMWR